MEKLLTALRCIIRIGRIMYHLVCSEIDSAIDSYEWGIEERQPTAAMVSSAAFLKPLRSSPRWPKLAKMMNSPATA